MLNKIFNYDLIKKYRVHIVVSILILIIAIGNLTSAKTKEYFNSKEKALLADSKLKEDTDNIIIKNSFFDLKLESESIEKQKDMLFYTKLPNDILIGNINAPITIINFFSYSCYFCKEFEKNVYEKLKSEYIDKGLVKLIYRAYSSKKTLMLSTSLMCVDKDIAHKMHKDFFKFNNSSEKTTMNFIIQTLKKYKPDANIEQFTDCFTNQELFEQTVYFQRKNNIIFEIEATPIFVINKDVYPGYRNFKEFKKILDNYVLRINIKK